MKEWPDASLIRYLGVGNSEVLVPNSMNAYKEVLQTQCYSFRKPDWFMRMVKEVIGKGLLAQRGEEHRAHRKMLNHPFSANNIRKLEPLFKAKAHGISSVFDEVIAAGDDDGKTGVIDCTETFSKATLDIMGVSILGEELSLLTTVKHGGKANASKSYASFNPAEYTFHQAYHVFFAPGQVGKLLTFFNGFFPTRWLPLEANAEFKFAMKWLNETLTTLVRDRYQKVRQAKASGKYDSGDSGDLTTFIVEESLPGGSAEGIQEEEFVGHVCFPIIARHRFFFSANSMASLFISSYSSWLLVMIRRQTCYPGAFWSWLSARISKTCFAPRSPTCFPGSKTLRTTR
jgi:cytochrome P450